jgi:hypothetical protein
MNARQQDSRVGFVTPPFGTGGIRLVGHRATGGNSGGILL